MDFFIRFFLGSSGIAFRGGCTNKYSGERNQPYDLPHLISGRRRGPKMNSENLQRAWELIAEKAARENDPQKHLKLIEELLSVMSQLHASRAKDRKKEGQK